MPNESSNQGPVVTLAESELMSRESSYRMALAGLLDAVERYPSSLQSAKVGARSVLRSDQLWFVLGERDETISAYVERGAEDQARAEYGDEIIDAWFRKTGWSPEAAREDASALDAVTAERDALLLIIGRLRPLAEAVDVWNEGHGDIDAAEAISKAVRVCQIVVSETSR